MRDKPARRALMQLWYELTGVVPAGTVGLSSTITFDATAIRIRYPDGNVVELTARTLAADDPAAAAIAESIRAIDGGDVE
jgi:hypothetical protein